MNTKRETFSSLFILLVAVLVFLPFITTFQDVLTRIILHFDSYKVLQNIVVPYEMKVLAAVLNLFRLQTEAGPSYVQFIRSGKLEVIYLAWNCIGWQSFLLFFITLITGLSGAYTKFSKFQAFLVGVLGTYLINIFRFAIVVMIYYFTGRGVGTVFHDYFSNLLSILWLFVYWWIAYKYILEEKNPLLDVKFAKRSKKPAIISASFISFVLSIKYYVLCKIKFLLKKLKQLNLLQILMRGKKDIN